MSVADCRARYENLSRNQKNKQIKSFCLTKDTGKESFMKTDRKSIDDNQNQMPIKLSVKRGESTARSNSSSRDQHQNPHQEDNTKIEITKVQYDLADIVDGSVNHCIGLPPTFLMHQLSTLSSSNSGPSNKKNYREANFDKSQQKMDMKEQSTISSFKSGPSKKLRGKWDLNDYRYADFDKSHQEMDMIRPSKKLCGNPEGIEESPVEQEQSTTSMTSKELVERFNKLRKPLLGDPLSSKTQESMHNDPATLTNVTSLTKTSLFSNLSNNWDLTGSSLNNNDQVLSIDHNAKSFEIYEKKFRREEKESVSLFYS